MTTKSDIPNIFKVHEAKFASDAAIIIRLQGELKEAKAQITREKEANHVLRGRLQRAEDDARRYGVGPAMMTATEVRYQRDYPLTWQAMHDLIEGIDYRRRGRGVYDPYARPTDYRKIGYEIGRRL